MADECTNCGKLHGGAVCGDCDGTAELSVRLAKAEAQRAFDRLLAKAQSKVDEVNVLRAELAALRLHQYSAAIAALRQKIVTCRVCGKEVPETPPGHRLAGCFPRHSFTAGKDEYQSVADWLESQAPKLTPEVATQGGLRLIEVNTIQDLLDGTEESGDIEHQIDCHADGVSELLRIYANAINRVKEACSSKVWEWLEVTHPGVFAVPEDKS